MKTRVVIVGAGLAGLVSIIEFIKFANENPEQSFELHIIEKRSLEFDRRQKLVNINIEEFRETNCPYPPVDWEKYCRETFKIPSSDNLRLFSSNNLSKTEKFVRKFARQPEKHIHQLYSAEVSQNFSIKELQLSLLEHIQKIILSTPNVDLHWHVNSKVNSIDFSAKSLNVIHNKEIISISFDHLLNCEGGKGETTALINRALQAMPDTSPFTFEEAKLPAFKHCAVRLKLKSSYLSENLVEELLKIQNPINLKTLKMFSKGFHQLGYYPDTSDKKSNNKKRPIRIPKFFIVDDNLYKNKYTAEPEFRIFIASEIPEAMFYLEDKDEKRRQIIDWAILLASYSFALPKECFEFDDKGETEQHLINAVTFENKIKFCDQPAIKLKNGISVFLVGDASKDNIYILGYSSKLVLNQAILAPKLICSSQPVQEYNDVHAFFKDFIIKDMEKLGKDIKRDFLTEYTIQNEQAVEKAKYMSKKN